jgi:hypothetical protein
MSCQHIEPFVVDLARGANAGQISEDALKRHILGCPSCAGLIERERAMSAALCRLAESVDDPAPNGRQEETLLAMFAEWHAHPHAQRAHAPLWAAAAAAVVIVGALSVWRPGTVTPAGNVADSQPAGASLHGQMASPAAGGEIVIDANRIPVVGSPSSGQPGAPAASVHNGEFMLWPGSTAWPPFESGELVRVTLRVDALPALGVPEPLTADALANVVQADVLVGQDGFARAIRLVQ